jgi:hypothetical protein
MIESRLEMRFLRTALAAMVFAVLSIGPALAQDVFEVTGIEVDESAADEVQAKFNAIADAQKRALQVVLRRLVQSEDVSRIPQVSGDVLNQMVRDYDITDEKLGGGRYIATISVRFFPEQVSGLLRDAQVPFAMARSQPVVVLPVIDSGSGPRLWDDPNPWRRVWAGRTPHAGLFPIVMPAGDLSDVATVNVNQAISGDYEALEAISDKYGASGAMVAIVSVSGGQSNRLVSVRLEFVGGDSDGMTFEERYKGSGNLTGFLDQVVADLLKTIERDWREQNMLDFSHVERTSLLVPIIGLADWNELRGKLEAISRIQTISLVRMSQEEVEIDIVYVGSTDQLRSSLAQHGLELAFSPSHPLWLLQRIGGN